MPAAFAEPLMVHSTWRTPAWIAARVSPRRGRDRCGLGGGRSPSPPPAPLLIQRREDLVHVGGQRIADRVGDVDGVAPGLDRASPQRQRISRSEREPSSASSTTSAAWLREGDGLGDALQHLVRVMRSFTRICSRRSPARCGWRGPRGGLGRLGRGQDVGVLAARTGWRSRPVLGEAPGDGLHAFEVAGAGDGEAGFRTVGPRSCSASAMRSFSSRFIEKPGDCRRRASVVSKIMMRHRPGRRRTDAGWPWQALLFRDEMKGRAVGFSLP